MGIPVRLEKASGAHVCDVELPDVHSVCERPDVIVHNGTVYGVRVFGNFSGPRRPAKFSYREITSVFLPLDCVGVLHNGDTISPMPVIETNLTFLNGSAD